MVDITTIKAMDRTIEILSPESSAHKIGIRVTILSIEDERMIKIKRSITNRRLALEQRGKHFKAEDIEENNDQLLFEAMTDWEWYNPTGQKGDSDFDPDAMPTFENGSPEFNKMNVMRVLKSIPWLRDQINEAVGDAKAFFDRSKSS